MNTHIRIIITLVIALMGGICIALLTRSHVALTGDSFAYTYAAASFRAGQGFVLGTGEPLTTFPPLYPVALAFAPPAVIAVASFMATIALTGVLLRQMALDGVWYVVGLIGVAFSPTLWWVHTFVWSEVLFMPLVLSALICLPHVRRWRWLLLAAALSALALMTRNAGFALVAVGLLAALWAHYPRKRTMALSAFVYGGVSLAPMALWMARNWLLMGSATGTRGAPIYGLVEALGYAANTVIGWLPYMVGVASIGLLISAIGWLYASISRTRSVRAGVRSAYHRFRGLNDS